MIGHFLVILLWVAGLLGLLICVMKARLARDKRRAPDWWKRQPP